MPDRIVRRKEFRELSEAILNLETPDECARFFRDLCTLPELKAMTERFQVAKRVSTGQTYREIAKKTGASTTTVTRVAYWVHHGMGGYKLVLERMRH